jgi:putative hydrolase of the HAD superfamily
MQRCLMLDVDGVVVTGRPEDGRSWATDIERDLGISPEKLHSLFFAPHWAGIVTGEKNLADVLAACLPALATALSVQEFTDYWFEKDSRLDEGVLAECGGLRKNGIRIFLATNQEHMRATFLMETLRLRDHVDGIIYSAQVKARKPQRAFFDAAEQRSGARPEELVLVDDTIANVEAARAASWRAVHWTQGSSLTSLLSG